jgi:flagellar hook assembly protein FlgD
LTQSIKPLTVYPNPFNGEMNISYENARSSKVSVEIVNLLGQSVKTLFNGQQAAGPYEMVWDATATNGSKVPFGTYFVRQVVDGKTSVKKVIYNR